MTAEAKTPELKNCPFCGSDAVIFCEQPRHGSYMRCRVCEACGPYVKITGSEEDAADAWNTRAEPQSPALDVEGEPPVALVLFCPACRRQHIDRDEWADRPHRSHLCDCGHIWRPADVPTVGVERIATCGKADSPAPDAVEVDLAGLEKACRDDLAFQYETPTRTQVLALLSEVRALRGANERTLAALRQTADALHNATLEITLKHGCDNDAAQAGMRALAVADPLLAAEAQLSAKAQGGER